MHRVAIIEDDAPTMRALSRAVEAHASLELAGTAATHREAFHLVSNGAFDALLVDINLGHLQSFDLIEKCREESDARIMVISVLGDEESVIAALEAGAHGYLLKDGAFSGIGDAIVQVLAGEAPISPGVARHLLRRFHTEGDIGPAEAGDFLTRRERQVLVEFARGHSYKEVAAKFDISIHTVCDYVKTLYRKLQVNSRSEAVSKAIRSRIIDI